MMDLQKYPKFTQDSRLVKRLGFLEIEWRRACPDVDLQEQLGWAYYWLTTRSKRYIDMGRFLSNWFKRCQEDINAMRNAGPFKTPPKYREQPPAGEVMGSEDWRKMREAL